MAQSKKPEEKGAEASNWRAHFGPLGGVLRVDWTHAIRLARGTYQGSPATEVPTSLPRGVTTVAGPGVRLEWLSSRAIRGALGGRIVEIYFRQILGTSDSLHLDLSTSRFRFDATRDLLRWTRSGEIAVSGETRAAVGRLYEGLFAGDSTPIAEALVTLGLSRDRSKERTADAIAALHAHFGGVSIRAVDFRRVNLLSTVWRLSTAAGKHGTQVSPDLLAVAFMLSTMT